MLDARDASVTYPSNTVPKTKLWCLPSLQLELLHAQHQTQVFPKHTHERYAIGVVERGALGFYYRGENIVASSGDISLCIPGEAHTGQPAAAEGWSYRMFYLDAQFVAKVASEAAGRQRALPFFKSGTLTDVALARRLYALHKRLETPEKAGLEHETALLQILATFIRSHADDTPPESQAGRENRAVQQVKDYLHSHYAEDVSLNDLSRITGLSRYHLVRTFCQTVGVAPHAYLRQVRIGKAKHLLAARRPIAEVALATGFTDQSHLTRWFKRFWGFTPGQYRNSVQDSTG